MKMRLWDKQECSFVGLDIPKLAWPAKSPTPWLYLYGDTGPGKTTMARWWVQQWERWEFVYCVSFVDHLRRATHDGQSYVPHIERLHTHPRMAIDDLGNEPDHPFTLSYKKNYYRSTPPEMMELALHRRHELGLWTIFTSNLSPFVYEDEEGKIIDWKRSQEESSLTEKYGEKTWRRVIAASTIYLCNGIWDLGQKAIFELKHKGLGRTKVPFWPSKPEKPLAPPTKKELTKTANELSEDNPIKPIIEKLAKKMKDETKRGGR